MISAYTTTPIRLRTQMISALNYAVQHSYNCFEVMFFPNKPPTTFQKYLTDQSFQLSTLRPDTSGPDFTLHNTPDQTLWLSNFVEITQFLTFNHGDWSPVCGDHMTLYNKILPQIKRFNSTLSGISVDAAKDRKLRFPLLSDFEPRVYWQQGCTVFMQRGVVTERAFVCH